MPYRPLAKSPLPAAKKLMITAAATMRMEAAVDRIPKDRPPIMTVAEPVSEEAASFWVGL
ncbi:hypothetical protein SDC9_171357 [bioreactor metagenome]|uniref:Uncharacterized protein n=1 Tax=bioreactor metagenome TaxID=1076179 RepID=A0A645GJ80_9ZZZZ